MRVTTIIGRQFLEGWRKYMCVPERDRREYSGPQKVEELRI